MKTLDAKRIIVTAGATIEPIDPVRFISNHSTGKMGYAISAELARRGAIVTLITGRTSLETPAGVERIDVLSAQDMFEAFMSRFEEADGAVMCAAVADYTPAEVSPVKIKKNEGDMVIRLKRTTDIAARAGEVKGSRLLVGFALETDNEIENAKSKLERKNLDFIVLNSLAEAGAGFGGDTNKITIIHRDGRENPFPLESKTEAAYRIAGCIEDFFVEKQ